MSEQGLRVLMLADVSPLQRSGGSARVIREQASRLAGRGHPVDLLCRHPGGPLPETAELGTARLRHYPVRRANALAYAASSILGARRALRAEAVGLADLLAPAVVLHQPFSACGFQLAGMRAGRAAYVFHSPAGVEYRLRAERSESRASRLPPRLVAALLDRLERRALRRADRVVVLSDFSRRLLERTHRHLDTSIVRIPGGVDLERFRPAADRESLRARLGADPRRPLLFTVRDLEPRMGVDTFLRALAGLRDLEAQAIVGGSGPLAESLREEAEGLGLAGSVRFTGHIPEPDLPLYYQAADLFVLPTRSHEGFGLVTVEALACGTPVVATPAGATPELLAPLEPRLLAAETTPEALREAIRRALPLAARAGFRDLCRSFAAERYSWERHVDALAEELFSGRMPSPRKKALAVS